MLKEGKKEGRRERNQKHNITIRCITLSCKNCPIIVIVVTGSGKRDKITVDRIHQREKRTYRLREGVFPYAPVTAPFKIPTIDFVAIAQHYCND